MIVPVLFILCDPILVPPGVLLTYIHWVVATLSPIDKPVVEVVAGVGVTVELDAEITLGVEVSEEAGV